MKINFGFFTKNKKDDFAQFLCSTNVSKFLSKFWLIQKGYSTVSKSRELDKTTANELGYFHNDKLTN